MDNEPADLITVLVTCSVIVGIAFWSAVRLGALRRLRRRGRIAVFTGCAVTALIVTLISQVNDIHAALSNRPSPSGATLIVNTSDNKTNSCSPQTTLTGLSAHDGSVRWSISPAPSGRAFFGSPNMLYIVTEEEIAYPCDRRLADILTSSDTLFKATSPQLGFDPSITALRLSDGAILWQLNALAYQNNAGPVLADGLLLFAMDAGAGMPAHTEIIVAVSLATHTVLWKTTLPDDPLRDQPFHLAAGADLLFVSSGDGEMSALRLSDGGLVWQERRSSEKPQNELYMMVAGDGLLYRFEFVASSTATPSITALRQSDGSVVWRKTPQQTPPGSMSSAVLGPDLFICGNAPGANVNAHVLYSFDAATGATRWSHSAACDEFTTPVESGDVVFIEDIGGIIALRASDGHMLWRASSGIASLSFQTIQVIDGVVFAGTFVNDYHAIPGASCDNVFLRGSPLCENRPYIAAFNATSGARYWLANGSGGLLGAD